ncbi:sigma-70 family RNA polymerase sigma factor [Listeria welshimeri]|uniref:RNA polymerase sigma factor n=1 Tax=Listeria welshimeri TaxID=1643 RepID=UPI001628D246|nr:sigma-70 family RNA polymerase sigma factor [Listeria welshimeri]MBC1445492.1 sigma-70 family RNA polymerase sigma factor [Listeria welshimeri]MBC2008881.1 sigma-70 family RNA polymerase sigma factor [Listeria welshimeri]MBF2508514.1 sigma-70 family RNA polymerase sigma factor [Listeria welshimeri]MBF2560208.1 sigma-70 family RNA polymerase sigma factor [Listeria welshimeri]MBF2565933.1 sigma-70 family RNA polymerase sigma factor [Listeria welshimeri]
MHLQSHKKHKQHAFDSYCKKILKNETRNIYKEIERLKKYEISIESLTEKELGKHVIYENNVTTEFLFFVEKIGTVIVTGELIAEAIKLLPKDKQDIILLSYFLGMSDRKIAEKMNLVRRTVSRRRNRALVDLKKIMEEYTK